MIVKDNVDLSENHGGRVIRIRFMPNISYVMCIEHSTMQGRACDERTFASPPALRALQ